MFIESPDRVAEWAANVPPGVIDYLPNALNPAALLNLQRDLSRISLPLQLVAARNVFNAEFEPNTSAKLPNFLQDLAYELDDCLPAGGEVSVARYRRYGIDTQCFAHSDADADIRFGVPFGPYIFDHVRGGEPNPVASFNVDLGGLSIINNAVPPMTPKPRHNAHGTGRRDVFVYGRFPEAINPTS